MRTLKRAREKIKKLVKRGGGREAIDPYCSPALRSDNPADNSSPGVFLGASDGRITCKVKSTITNDLPISKQGDQTEANNMRLHDNIFDACLPQHDGVTTEHSCLTDHSPLKRDALDTSTDSTTALPATSPNFTVHTATIIPRSPLSKTIQKLPEILAPAAQVLGLPAGTYIKPGTPSDSG
ncbi:hypothetical protein IWZ01DRAFT_481438 [Phyllosticta capitalensis]